MPLRVWVDNAPVGIVDKLGKRGSTLVYDHGVSPDKAISVILPPRLNSYDEKHELLPFLDMNLPEGALRERLRLRFAKAMGSFDDMDVLSVTGRSQIGRVRFTPLGEDLDEDVPFHSVDEIVRARRGGDLYDYLMDTFARHSGLSGVQPKAMFRGEDDKDVRKSQSLRGATHIVKFWDADEYPELAANEFFCLKAAQAAGLRLPNFQLSDTGEALVVERFDRRADGTYRGFEDFCAINGANASQKYNGGYETKLFKRLSEFIDHVERKPTAQELFRLMVLNIAVRNGDAHLKNFGILYDATDGVATLAPVYDIVTTQAYLPKDKMALTLNGSTDWPDRKKLLYLAQTRCGLSVAAATTVMEEVADAVSGILPEAKAYFDDCPHPEVGERMFEAWDRGVQESLGLGALDYVQGHVIKP